MQFSRFKDENLFQLLCKFSHVKADFVKVIYDLAIYRQQRLFSISCYKRLHEDYVV